MHTPVHLMAKPTSYQCNLHCEYCFYLDKSRYFKGKGRDVVSAMSDDVLRTYIKQYIALNDSEHVDFAWQGGEPTLAGIAFYQKVIHYQKKFANGKNITNSLQTNAVLIDKQWANFLRENHFLVGVSIDGPRELHDVYRVSQGGKPTYERVIKGINHLKQQGVPFNTLTVINNINVHQPLDVYNHLKELGATYHQYIPVVEWQNASRQNLQKTNNISLIHLGNATQKSLTPFSIQNGEDYGRFLIAIFDEWLEKDLGRIYIQHIEEMVRKWAGIEGGLCLFQKTCGQALVLERNGDIYSCDHYVYPENRLGNLLDGKIRKLVKSKQQRAFANEKANVGKKCEECRFLFACRGGCPKHRAIPNADGTRQNHLCNGYSAFFKHIDPVITKMANDFKRTHGRSL